MKFNDIFILILSLEVEIARLLVSNIEMGTLNGSFSYAIPSELVVYGGWSMFFVENRFQFHRLWQHVERDKKIAVLI